METLTILSFAEFCQISRILAEPLGRCLAHGERLIHVTTLIVAVFPTTGLAMGTMMSSPAGPLPCGAYRPVEEMDNNQRLAQIS